MPNTIAGKGKYKYKSPAHTKPAAKPNNALTGTLLRGLRTKANPVRTSRTQTSTMLDWVTKTTAPVIINRTPISNPKTLSPLRTFPAEPFTNRVSSFEIATNPPNIRINGTKFISTEKSKPVGIAGSKFTSHSESNVRNILKFSPRKSPKELKIAEKETTAYDNRTDNDAYNPTWRNIQ